MLTQMHVRGLMFDPYTNAYIVILRDESNTEMLPIWVGKPEASAISFAMEGITTPRPMTHDLMKVNLDTAEAKVISVVVTDLKDNTYYAKIHLSYEDSEYSIDARPSDAIALAMRSKAPVFVNDNVIRKNNSEDMDRWWRISSPRISASTTRNRSLIPVSYGSRSKPERDGFKNGEHVGQADGAGRDA